MAILSAQAAFDLVPATPLGRLVEVAIDAAGGVGTRTYTYAVPPALDDLLPGEAVLVEFGKRQALGVVLAEAAADPTAIGFAPKPILDRVRADGPLLPGLSIELARWIAAHYLAPASLVIRAMLPPGLLERLELVAERIEPVAAARAVAADGAVAGAAAGAIAGAAAGSGDGAPGDLDDMDRALLDQLELGPRAVRRLDAGEGRAHLLRRLHGLAASGRITLDWTLTAAGGGPRYERRVTLTDAGRVVAALIQAGERAPGRPLGARQAAALAELATTDGTAPLAAEIAERHGAGTVPGLDRRGLVAITVAERERRPLEGRSAGRRGSRPAAADLTAPQQEAVEIVQTAIAAGDPTPLVLDGVTGAGKTAVYVEAIVTSLEAGRPVLLLVPEIALALPLVDRLRADVQAEVALVHSGLGDGERADEWRRIRAGRVDVVVGTRLAVLSPLPDIGLVIVDEEHDGGYKSDRTPRI
ncbi:MAG TPA: DEAD/DEAH box helicase, partial [Candidatus Acidoferrum sp.]|nr:DEAD/DEAH box helicase [Candidatus Acidoferrum sp.]